jgi:hypothetical protein
MNEITITKKIEAIKQVIDDRNSNIITSLTEFIIKRLSEVDHDETSFIEKEKMIDLAFNEKRIDEMTKHRLFKLLLDVQQCFLGKSNTLNFVNMNYTEEDTMNGKMKNHHLITYLKEYDYPLQEEDRVKLMKHYYLEMNKTHFDEEELKDIKSAINENRIFIRTLETNKEGRKFS